MLEDSSIIELSERLEAVDSVLSLSEASTVSELLVVLEFPVAFVLEPLLCSVLFEDSAVPELLPALAFPEASVLTLLCSVFSED